MLPFKHYLVWFMTIFGLIIVNGINRGHMRIFATGESFTTIPSHANTSSTVLNTRQRKKISMQLSPFKITFEFDIPKGSPQLLRLVGLTNKEDRWILNKMESYLVAWYQSALKLDDELGIMMNVKLNMTKIGRFLRSSIRRTTTFTKDRIFSGSVIFHLAPENEGLLPTESDLNILTELAFHEPFSHSMIEIFQEEESETGILPYISKMKIGGTIVQESANPGDETHGETVEDPTILKSTEKIRVSDMGQHHSWYYSILKSATTVTLSVACLSFFALAFVHLKRSLRKKFFCESPKNLYIDATDSKVGRREQVDTNLGTGRMSVSDVCDIITTSSSVNQTSLIVDHVEDTDESSSASSSSKAFVSGDDDEFGCSLSPLTEIDSLADDNVRTFERVWDEVDG